MESVTFGRVDDFEEQALKDIILRANADEVLAPTGSGTFPDHHEEVHQRILMSLTPAHALEVTPILDACSSGRRLTREMALEAGLAFNLARQNPEVVRVFGTWDYVTHQVLASPFKPLKWADRMDIFGYRYLPGFRPTVAAYLVIELKTEPATPDDVDQLIKYVDWLKDEYSGGDYSLINAFLVAASFPDSAKARVDETGLRSYGIGRHPMEARTWDEIQLVRYEYNRTSHSLTFESERRTL
jgi:hypothetical protein